MLESLQFTADLEPRNGCTSVDSITGLNQDILTLPLHFSCLASTTLIQLKQRPNTDSMSPAFVRQKYSQSITLNRHKSLLPRPIAYPCGYSL